MTLEEALLGRDIPREIRQSLVLLDIEYWDFDEQLQTGQMVVRHELGDEVRAIFQEIFEARFPIEKMIPVVHYNWSDDLSVADNNSSAFNYRTEEGDKLSVHAFGRAIDINPRQNPFMGKEVKPPGAVRDERALGTLLEDGAIVRAFESRGWIWGGRWATELDWHHFEKADEKTEKT